MIASNTDDAELKTGSPTSVGDERGYPEQAAVTFVTTEHLTLQRGLSQAISELSLEPAFLASVSGALTALGLMATATHIGSAFCAFALVVLPTLSLIGLVTFERAVQTSDEDHSCALRIARLRCYYFHHAPGLVDYLLSVPPEKRLVVQGLANGSWQGTLTIPGMVALITTVLTGATAGMLDAIISAHSLAAALTVGSIVAARTMWSLWRRGRSERKSLASMEDQSAQA